LKVAEERDEILATLMGLMIHFGTKTGSQKGSEKVGSHFYGRMT